jgi:hypothetical protein
LQVVTTAGACVVGTGCSDGEGGESGEGGEGELGSTVVVGAGIVGGAKMPKGSLPVAAIEGKVVTVSKSAATAGIDRFRFISFMISSNEKEAVLLVYTQDPRKEPHQVTLCMLVR